MWIIAQTLLRVCSGILLLVIVAALANAQPSQTDIASIGNTNVVAGSTTPESPEHPLAGALKLTRLSRESLSNVLDYEATLTKRELLSGQLQTSQMQLRIRHKPFSVYLKYVQPNAGREVLYHQAVNPNMILAHEGQGLAALAGTLNLAVNAPEVMKENHYPVNMAGMSNLLEEVIKQWELEAKYGEINVQYYPDAKIGQVETVAIEVTHPQPRKQFPYSMVRVYLDRNTHLPIRVELYTWPKAAGQVAPLYAEYTYTNIKTNVGLQEYDFDRRNPRYKF
jgi:hypothetical protein